MSFITYKFRVKDKTVGKYLDRMAIATNQVWNFCVATQREAERRRKGGMSIRWPTAFDLINLTSGSSRELGIHSDTINQICRQFTRSRDYYRRCPRFRSSFTPRRALGWVPFRGEGRSGHLSGDAFLFMRRRYRFWKSREVEGIFKSGAFVQDARGRWYIVIDCEVECKHSCGEGAIGVDLGLKTFATLSDGSKIPAMRHYRRHEEALAKAQRSNNKKRVRAIHAKIANTRRHDLHVASKRLIDDNRLIVVGNVNAGQLAKTRMAKSVLDAGWSTFRHMLRYKAASRLAVYVEVDERYTSQTCSECGSVSGPRGLKGLGVRSWDCGSCGAHHDRDVNAAKRILASGRNAALQLTEIAA